MVNIGHRPVLWHVMKYYAHFGHKDFILCLGHQSEVIKDYFLHYDECVSNDFTLSQGGKKINLANSDIDDWTISFVDTGRDSTIQERLQAVESYLEGEQMFLANYSDSLTDFHLPALISRFMREDKLAAFLCVKSSHTFHVVETAANGDVSSIKQVSEADVWLNGGYFVFRKDIFKYMDDGDNLVNGPFQKLIQENKLLAYKYDGFWACMDTFKEKQCLEDLSSRGNAPWQVWLNQKTADPTSNHGVHSG